LEQQFPPLRREPQYRGAPQRQPPHDGRDEHDLPRQAPRVAHPAADRRQVGCAVPCTPGLKSPPAPLWPAACSIEDMDDGRTRSRRPIARLFRRTAQGAVRAAVRFGIHPNTISLSSIAVSAGAAICYWSCGSHPLLLVAAPAFCYLRLWLNMLDGMVAIASGK